MKAMKAIKAISVLIIVAILGGWFVFKSLIVFVPVGFVGVRTQEYAVFGSKGVVQKDFPAGWHRDFGPIDTWLLFDSTIQTLEMTRNPEKGSEKGRDDINVQSADGYAVSVDVTLKYRIKEGMAHKVFQDTGSGVIYKTTVRTKAEQACMGIFGQMKTEDFYDPRVRVTRSEEVKKVLAEYLGENFIEVVDVLIRDVAFDPEYENKIRRKKLADQEVELNKSMARAEEMSGKTQVIEADTQKKVLIIEREKEAEIIRMKAETDRSIATIAAEADKYVTQKKADADLVNSQKKAEGTLLVRQAEAEGERLRNQAMQGVGGSTIVALEAAKNLNLSDFTVSTQVMDILDLDSMATRLGVPAAGK